MISLKDRELEREGLLETEGAFLFERLLESNLTIDQIWCSPAVYEKYDLQGLPCAVLSREELSRQAGYKFHRGVLALAKAPLLPSLPQRNALPDRGILVLPRLGDPENLGGILRTALGLGIKTVFLGPALPYVFGRKVLHSAMGAQFKLNLYRFDSAKELFDWNGGERPMIAAALEEESVELPRFTPPRRWMLAMGHEGHGLDRDYLDGAAHKVIIPQSADVDSLNVNVAAGIVLYGLMGEHGPVPQSV
ncbi:MAG: RNA methyltransferase [Spirochaetales bacterium]|nr:RNA methyltransferase [Spirochaetales bacterium]